ncbi:MAG: hypothetical protein A2Y67_02475 [Candidatus Buchananbacteria bacterium RBG_13_39_9]|uniref:Uncharacterized protein n=1 Tax=Candidatus Buchananbacteria bacterium RBG_13_39_9 TaxID=1797531 RepID=A0A1G1XRZ8_9BACT|nr:MAG: hypothetical protein A2Y67_02475 [Candidatus Buchananbacteria bacterium RBG_13_39_9]
MNGKVIGHITPAKPPQMEEGVFYDLTPPSVIQGKIYHRVMCEYRVPNQPDEYVVKGIPEGGVTPKSFVLKFTDRGKVIPRKSENQQGF